MMKRFFGLTFGVLYLCGFLGCAPAPQPTLTTSGEEQVDKKIVIGSGKRSKRGVYYPTGKNICGVINSNSNYKIVCESVATQGSVDNIKKVLSGKVQFGIAQSDIQSDAWEGLGKWRSKGPQKKLRSVLGLHDEPSFAAKATLITSSDVPDDLVYVLTKLIFENFEEFKNLHKAYDTITKENMLQGLTAPVHPGAIKYYKEIGLY
jgi:TRAP-type uncharacterized transport system substrate-binding protein